MQLIFDLDGTLLDTSIRHHTVYEKITRESNGRPLSKDVYWQLKRRNTKWPEILEASGINPDQTKAFLEKFIELIEQVDMLRLDELFPFSLSCLESLSNHELYLVSLRRNEANLREQIKWLELTPHFQKVVTGHTEGEGFEMKKQLIAELAAKNAAVIGDTEADVKAAQALGLTSIAVTSGIRDETFLQNLHPDHILPDASHVPTLVSS